MIPVLRGASALLTVLTLVTASCGASASVPPSGAAAATPAPTATPSPPIAPTPAPTAAPAASAAPPSPPSLDSSEAGSAYLAAATAWNTILHAQTAKLPSDPSLAQLRAWGTNVAKPDETFESQLRAIKFPPSTAALVELFLAKRAELATAILKVAHAKSVNEAVNAFNEAADLNNVASTMAAAIRQQLGLPPLATPAP